MTRFTTRVELHKTISGEYQILHEEMELKKFRRTITYSKIKYHLPDAEYNYQTKDEIISTVKVRDMAIVACKKAVKRIFEKKKKFISEAEINKLFSILVTKADGNREIYNLTPVKD
jgi:hypothetical protein